MIGFEPRTLRLTSDNVNEYATTTLVKSTGSLDNIQENQNFPKLQKSEEILEIRKKLKFSFSEFRKNRFDNFTKSI